MALDESKAPNEVYKSIGEYGRILFKRLWTIVAVFIITLVLAGFYTYKQKKVYQATASVVIDPSAPRFLNTEIEQVVDVGSPGGYWIPTEFYETEYQILASRKLASIVVEDFGFSDDIKFLGLEEIQDDQELQKLLENADAVSHFMGMTKIEPRRNSQTVYIKINHNDPKMAQKCADGLAEAYKEQNISRKLKATNEASEWLKKQYQHLKTQVETAEDDLYQFKQDRTYLLDVTSKRLLDKDSQLTQIRLEKYLLEAKVGQIQALKGKKLETLPLDIVLDNPLIQRLKEEYIIAKATEAELSGRYLEKHPKLIAVKNQLKVLERSLRQEIDRITDSYEKKLNEIVEVEKQVRQDFYATKKEAEKLSREKQDYDKTYERLERDRKIHLETFQMIQRRLKEIDLTKLLKENNIRILDYAKLPTRAIQPKVTLNMMFGALLGLLFGIIVALFLEFLDNTVKTQDDIERIAQIPFLGLIPSIKSDGLNSLKLLPELSKTASIRDLYVHHSPKSNIAESCRTIRTNIMFTTPGKKLKRLLITSASSREGKTATAISMSVVMAQSGNKVLLIDTDMRRPRAHQAFGLRKKVGISSLIIKTASFDQAIQKTGIPNLDFIACGPIPPNPSELLHTNRFRELLDEFSEIYDWVILDSPPVLAVTDAAIMGNFIDGVILVVKSNSTSRGMLAKTKETLATINAPILGSILNNVNLSQRQYKHQYYYYYRQYGHYYETDEKSS